MTYDHLKGKKILVLGGNIHQADIVLKAKALGMETYVTDWNPVETSPGKQLADRYADISLSDIEGVARYIRENGIDGVVTGFTDSYLPYYIDICAKAGLPCYMTHESLKYTLDKALFKEACHRSGIGTIPGYDSEEVERNPAVMDGCYPVLIKPVDNSGSRGICVCRDAASLQGCLDYAKENSRSGKLLIEKYFDKDDVSVAYVFRNGRAYLSAVCDRYMIHTPNGSSVTSGLIYPSRYLERYEQSVDGKLKEMFRRLGFDNGVLFLQAFADGDDFYFYEMGYRLSGGRHYVFTKQENGVSALEMLLNYAVTGDMGSEIERETPRFRDTCVHLSVLCKGETEIGRIEGLEGIEDLPGMIDCLCLYKEGETTGRQGTTSQIVLKVSFYVPEGETIEGYVAMLRERLHVLDRNGDDIMEEWFL